ncbi:tetratricopeptide repeat protein [Nostoc sp. CENA67]|uniref:Tetratricopeptide repeat protein n=1 Tax=Amazonocrinis nigriterrae CENA67 TaxID=2794033 RepID=A0A8J7HTK9_9NOST|nr:tetratricopeptide repeat protein [Amazonocrinis nigriterrae]MBH8562254.1 tetratricopeptide repeat protein [Amazonocrinis nigriterrae CENA67]
MKSTTKHLFFIFGVCFAFIIFPVTLYSVAKAQEQSACPDGQVMDSNNLCSSNNQEQESESMEKAEEFFRRGREFGGQGQSQEAIAEYTRAIELDLNYAEAYFYRGNTLALERQAQKGIEDIQKAATIFTSRGELQKAEAVQQYEEIIRQGIEEGEF